MRIITIEPISQKLSHEYQPTGLRNAAPVMLPTTTASMTNERGIQQTSKRAVATFRIVRLPVPKCRQPSSPNRLHQRTFHVRRFGALIAAYAGGPEIAISVRSTFAT